MLRLLLICCLVLMAIAICTAAILPVSDENGDSGNASTDQRN